MIFCAPAVALLGGAGLAALVRPWWRGALAWVPAVVALAVVGLWLVRIGPRPHDRLLHGLGFRLLRKWRVTGIWLLLYARTGQVG